MSLKQHLPKSPSSILLINAPAFDTRLPWAAWHQPVGLLKIGAWLRDYGYDVRLIDCLQIPGNNRLPKEKKKSISIQNTKIDFWRIGLSPQTVIGTISLWIREGWSPQLILVSVGMSFWWESANELIGALKHTYDFPIVLGGVYPTYYYDHALEKSNADRVVRGIVNETRSYESDLSLYKHQGIPSFAAIQFLNITESHTEDKSLSSKRLINEIKHKVALGIKTLAFFDDYIGPEDQESFLDTLRAISNLNLPGIKFIAPGNISPRVVNAKVAKYLNALNFKHIFLHDDVIHSPTKINYLSNWDDYERCIEFLHKAGFKHRTDELGAAIIIGLPKENLADLTQHIVRLSSVVGSVHLVPYQYTAGTIEGKKYESWFAQRNGHLDITKLNGRLFPLARLAGHSFNDYLEITRLVALLNSKFRSQTFDFLSNSITAKMVRKSLSERLWDPSLRSLLEKDSRIQLEVVQK